MKKFSLYLLLISFLLTVSSCMILFNLALPDGIYVVGDWNDWSPTENDKMVLSESEDYYIFTLPLASLTFYPSEEDPNDHIGWYKVVYVGGGNVISSSAIPVWKENVDGTCITVYASPVLMKDGEAAGVGDSEKMNGDWYVAGDFNSWKLVEMIFDGRYYFYEIDYSGNTGEVIKYKIARSDSWKPYEMQFSGRIYNARMGEDGVFTANAPFTRIKIVYDPMFSILNLEAK